MARDERASREAAYQRGLKQELLAAWWLRLKGYRILVHRYRTPLGEIDLVASRGKMLAFIEIKARATPEAALQAITPHQQARIRQAAHIFLQNHPALINREMRFDAFLACPGRLPKHVKDAWR
jgi:putative endonuclease